MDTPNSASLPVHARQYNVAQISFLIACGSALQLAESFIPSPIPGMKIGLANISTLLGLILFGIPAALEVAVFRPVVTSLTNGTFLSPGFILSFWGSLAGCAVMAAFWYVSRNRRFFSLTALSIISAVAHNTTQLIVAYLWLIPHKGIFAFYPFFLLSAGVCGYMVGWSSKYVLDKIHTVKSTGFERLDRPVAVPQAAELTFKDKFKILGAFALIIGTIFWESLAAYGILIAVVLLLIVLYRQKITPTLFIRLSGAIIFSFFLPVIYSKGGDVLWQWHWIRVTTDGIMDGVLFAVRLLFLILISVWIGITEPDKLSRELAWMLSPLKFFHFSVDRIPRITSLSLSFIPVVWERLAVIKPKTLTSVLDALAVFFVSLE